MRRWLLAALAVTLGVASSIASAPAETVEGSHRVALVIGNSAYSEVGRLASPVQDAKRWATALEGAGFNVLRCLDCKLGQMKDILKAFGAKIGPGDEAFFYYSGHGAEENDQNLLFPVDADIQGCGTLFDQSVNLSLVLDGMDLARVKVVMLDACRSSPFPTCTKDLDRLLFTPPKALPDGTLIAYATKRGAVAADSEQGSPYTRAVLPLAFQPGLPLLQALSAANPQVKEATGGRQEPWVQSSLSGAPYILVPGEAARVADDAWRVVEAMPNGPEKLDRTLKFLQMYGRTDAQSVDTALSWITEYQASGRSSPDDPKIHTNKYSRRIDVADSSEANLVVFEEDFSTTEEGQLPDGWTSDDGVGVVRKGGRKCLGALAAGKHHVATEPIHFPLDFTVEVDMQMIKSTLTGQRFGIAVGSTKGQVESSSASPGNVELTNASEIEELASAKISPGYTRGDLCA